MTDQKDQQKNLFHEDDSSSSSAGSAELLCNEKVEMRDVWKRRKIEHDAQNKARKPVFFSQQKRFYFNKKPKETNKEHNKKHGAQQGYDARAPNKAALSTKPAQPPPRISKNISYTKNSTPTKPPLPLPPPPPSICSKPLCDHKTALVASKPKAQTRRSVDGNKITSKKPISRAIRSIPRESKTDMGLGPTKFKTVNPPRNTDSPSTQSNDKMNVANPNPKPSTQELDTRGQAYKTNPNSTSTAETVLHIRTNSSPSAEETQYISSVSHHDMIGRTTLVSRSTQTLDSDFPSDEPENPAPPLWSLVSINANEVDSILWPNVDSAPILYGVVENPAHHDDFAAAFFNEEEQSFVVFVVSGEAEWIDNSSENTIKCAVDNERLTVVEPPPIDMKKSRLTIKKDHLKWFKKYVVFGDKLGWKVKHQLNPCPKCGSKWCMYYTNKEKMDRVIETIRMLDDDEPAEKKRHMAYRQGIFEAYGKLGFKRRKRVGFCFSTKVKSAFPSDFYTGFRGIGENNSESDSTSDNSRTSVIQLSD